MEEQRRREMEQERRERGPPPASRVALKNIPDVTIAAHDLAEETNRSCSVCLDDHELGGKAVKLPCAHIFHRECVWEWLELHCTCPVCRFELETEDRNYERERRVRMKGRRPRYRRRELDGLSIPQIRNLARQQNVDIAGCLEKKDIVRSIVNSGMVELVESETPKYDADELSHMSMRQLRSLMLQAGIEVEGCLERSDLLDRIRSSRLVTVTHHDPFAPPGVAEAASSPATAAFAPTVTPTTAPAFAPTATPAAAPAAAPSGEGGGGGGGGNTSWSSIFNWGARSGTAGASAPSQVPAPAPSTATTSPLESMSVKDLRGIMSRLGVTTQGCIEKRDMVERIRACGRYREGLGGGR